MVLDGKWEIISKNILLNIYFSPKWITKPIKKNEKARLIGIHSKWRVHLLCPCSTPKLRASTAVGCWMLSASPAFEELKREESQPRLIHTKQVEPLLFSLNIKPGDRSWYLNRTALISIESYGQFERKFNWIFHTVGKDNN